MKGAIIQVEQGIQMAEIEKTEVMPGIVVCKLPDSLGQETPQTFEKEMKEYVTSGKKRIVFDMQDVTYVDSMWIGSLLRLNFAAREAGVQLRLSGLSLEIATEFRNVGMYKSFHVFPSVKEALAAE